MRLATQGFLFDSVCPAAATGLTGPFVSGSSALLLAAELTLPGKAYRSARWEGAVSEQEKQKG